MLFKRRTTDVFLFTKLLITFLQLFKFTHIDLVNELVYN